VASLQTNLEDALGEGARKTEPVNNKGVLEEANMLVSSYADRGVTKVARPAQPSSHMPKRLSMTRFPERLEAASNRGLSWTLLVVAGFGIGVAIMIAVLA